MLLVIKRWTYDEETYPNCFTLSLISSDGAVERTFEVSEFKNEIKRLYTCIDYLIENDCELVGFNNLGFDYPILHKIIEQRDRLITLSGKDIAAQCYKWAQEQIDSFKNSPFGNTVAEKDRYIRQIDLYKIWHFDNKAKNTGLKMLEFNMRADNIEELPYAVGTRLTEKQIKVLLNYNLHDVRMTNKFLVHSSEQILFREKLTEKYGRDFMNHNDTKIGKDYFIMRLEEAGIPVYKKVGNKRELIQSPRPVIKIADCLFNYYDFKRPEFQAVQKWFSQQRIRETKGVFSNVPEHKLGDLARFAEMREHRDKIKILPGHKKPTQEQIDDFKRDFPLGWIEEIVLKAEKVLRDENGKVIKDANGVSVKENVRSYFKVWRAADNLNVVVDGFRFDFGTGGIHGSISSKVVNASKKWKLLDADVSSMYPNLAIANSAYPEHLTEKFCEIYRDVYEQRKSYPKGTAENAMLKLALNGVYGDSNNKYSPFYDPKYTMTITINGQLSLCLLAEYLMEIPNIRIIQVNTDGITVAINPEQESLYYEICKRWENRTKLQLEFAEYSKMIVRDCNAYVALYTNGKTKRKGPYEYQNLGWHQDQGGLVAPMAAEAHMLFGKDIEEFLKNHQCKFDFMYRTKIPKSSRLIVRMPDGTEVDQQNICRYYVSNHGGRFVKVMPPAARKAAIAAELGEEIEDRNISVQSGWNVKTCNDIKDYDGDINIEFYKREAEKLVITDVYELD